MKIEVTRAVLNAALAGSLTDVETDEDPYFGFQVPRKAPGVPTDILNPRKTWRDPKPYDEQAKKLAGMFRENFEQFADGTTAQVANAGPRVNT